MTAESILHRLSLAVRLVDHFSEAAPEVEFPVRLGGSLARPVLRPGGGGARQSDGTYRFRDLAIGTSRVLWRLPFTRGHGGWTRWEDDPEVTLPRPDPATPMDIVVWPEASAPAPAGATGVRGKLIGANAQNLTVRIARQGQPFDRLTRSNETGEFLFLPPGGLTPSNIGLVPLTIAVSDAGGAPRVVTGGRFVPSSAGADFVGANFVIPPRSVPRVLFTLA